MNNIGGAEKILSESTFLGGALAMPVTDSRGREWIVTRDRQQVQLIDRSLENQPVQTELAKSGNLKCRVFFHTAFNPQHKTQWLAVNEAGNVIAQGATVATLLGQIE